MFLNFIKQFLIRKRLKSLVKLNRHFIFPKKISKIDLLVDVRYWENQSELLSKIKEVFGNDKVVSILYYEANFKKFHNLDMYFYNKDISVKGKFSERIKSFLDRKSDIFISYNDLNNPYINWFSFHKKADFKIGFYQTNPKIYDLLINSNSKDFEANFNEMNKYLKIINQNK